MSPSRPAQAPRGHSLRVLLSMTALALVACGVGEIETRGGPRDVDGQDPDQGRNLVSLAPVEPDVGRTLLQVEVGDEVCAGHCTNESHDCGEEGVDCGGPCAACTDPCAGHCSNGMQDCGEEASDCGGGCVACADPCALHCASGARDCGETGVDCGGSCAACPDPCAGHCSNGSQDCGESGVDCGGECLACGSVDDAQVDAHTIPAALSPGAVVVVSITMRNSGDTTWFGDGSVGYKLGYVGDMANVFLPEGQAPRAPLSEGQSVPPAASWTFYAAIQAPDAVGSYVVELRMLRESVAWFGESTAVELTVADGVEQPTGACGEPLPPRDHERSKINMHCGATWCDATPICHGCDYCEAIGMPCMPGSGPEPPCIARCDCPTRPEGNPERVACELYFLGGLPLWRSDGQTIVNSSNAFLARCDDCSWIEVCRADGTLCNRVDF